jgi:hypothetical protein
MGVIISIKRSLKMRKEKPEDVTLWQAFVQSLSEVDSTLDAALTPNDELTRAEGYRHLARMIAEGIRTFVEYPDAIHPCISEKPFYAGDTSDARYFDAIIDGSQSYCIEGYRGTAPLIEFSVYDGKPGVDKNSKPIACILESDLVVEDDQTYRIILSPDEHEGNWIKIGADIKYIFIRQYAHDWRKTQKASFNIRNMNNNSPPPQLSIAIMRERLFAVSQFVSAIARQWTKQVNVIRVVPANKLIKAPEGMGQAIPSGHNFASGNFKLEQDEALVIDFKPPADVPYWGFQLTNFWFEPLDFGLTGSHTNNKMVSYSDDGWVRLVIAPHDPDSPNWLQTQMHTIGVMIFRLSRKSVKDIPGFVQKVVKVSEVKLLPKRLP